MKATIDFQKSIRKQRLVYQGSASQRRLIMLGDIIPCVLALAVTLSLFFFIYYNGPARAIPFASIPVLLVIVSMFLHNRLARVNRKNGVSDRNEIIRHLLRKHPGIIRHNSSEQVIIITDTSRLLIFKKTYLILQDESNVYMHLSLTARGKLKYILFPIPLYFMSRAILYSFSKRMVRAAS